MSARHKNDGSGRAIRQSTPNGLRSGRFHNVTLIKLPQAQEEEENTDAYLLFLKMENVYDRLSWDFLTRAAAEAVVFGLKFLKNTQLCYCYAYTNAHKRRWYVNGFLGPIFDLHSGMAHGCPISSLLLLLLITEPLEPLSNSCATGGHDSWTYMPHSLTIRRWDYVDAPIER